MNTIIERRSTRVAAATWIALGTAVAWGQPVQRGMAPSNTITLRVAQGQTVRRGPVTISRFFRSGEIYGAAVARIGGRDVPTQNDVKTRWSNGSLKHALLTFQADLTNVPEQVVTFVPGVAAMGSLQMVPEIAQADAVMAISNGQGQRTDIRLMDIVRSGASIAWMNGPLCTQVVAEDRSPAQRYDVAFNGHRSFHPIFVMTIYSNWPGVKVEFIGENAWTNAEQDIRYTATLSGGLNAGSMRTMETLNNLNHVARTRWRRTHWIGAPAPDFDIDHNLAYLTSTGALPNFDTSIRLSPRAITEEVNEFHRTDRGAPLGSGSWARAFPMTGGRPDIGLIPRWDARYLYSFDRRLRDIMLANANMSGSVPVHMRESALNNRFYHPRTPVPAFGRPVSTDARPTMSMVNEWMARTGDQIRPVGPASKGGWILDVAHQPNFVYVAYLLTGDWYFHEELMFWASHNTVWGNPGRSAWGSAAPWAIMVDQIRGDAWAIRTLAEAAAMAPDGTPEKTYFSEKLFNNIAAYEGRLNIRNGSFFRPCTTTPYRMASEQSIWCYGRNTLDLSPDGNNPLRYWRYHGVLDARSMPGYVDPTAASGLVSGFMQNFLPLALAHVEELGFPEVAPLRAHFGFHLASQALDPAWGPELLNLYLLPMVDARTRGFFRTWADARAAITPQQIAGASAYFDAHAKETEHGYANIARASLSTLANDNWGAVRGSDAWRAFEARYQRRPGDFSMNPKWAIVPR